MAIARNMHRNITCFLGIIHCHNMALFLQRVGYEVIFEKGVFLEENFLQNIFLGHRLKQEYKDFLFLSF